MSQEEKMVSETEAWQEIARRIDGEGLWYLCHGADDLYVDDRISNEMCSRMHARVRRYLRVGGTFLSTVVNDSREPCLHSEELRPAKVLAALFLALEAEDESSALPSSGSQGPE